MKSIVYSAFFLLFTFFGVAGIYIVLGADFVAMVQLIVYVGGILILILFGVMLTNRITNMQIKTKTSQMLPATIGVAMFAGLLCAVFVNTPWRKIDSTPMLPTTQALGVMLISEYGIVFELLGILLLIALIGAASLARK
jgi:NADH-quinone oxidoreductase subunit J